MRVWQCDYFGNTLQQIALCMIQFAKAVYSENSLKFSILVKMLHNIFRHNTDYVIYSGVCFAACLPATVLHDLLRDKFLLKIGRLRSKMRKASFEDAESFF